MKTNKYSWESNFYIISCINNIHAYDILSKNMDNNALFLDISLTNEINTNRPNEVIKTISYLNNLSSFYKIIPLLQKQFNTNKKDKEKENKFRLILSWSPSFPVFVYLYFFYLAKIFKLKNIKYSLFFDKTTYNSILSSLNNTLKIGSNLHFNDIDPKIYFSLVYKNIAMKYLITLLASNI